MASYQCPMCGRNMDRNLILFLDHTNQHVIDQIKKKYPEWVAEDGICKPCADYYTLQLQGELSELNIGPDERRKRFVMGIAMLALSAILALILMLNHSAHSWRLLLFLPFFLGMLGLIQDREKTCVLLAELGVQNMDSGEKKIDEITIANELKKRGRKILAKSVFSAALVTAVLFLFP